MFQFGIHKILIANRGEIAIRIVRACKDLHIANVAIYTKPDAECLHVKVADEAYCVGDEALKGYLDPAKIIEVAKQCGADAIHPGYGFLSENQNFVEICAKHDIKFIGPSVQAMALMSDKSKAKQMMMRAGIPVVPGSDGEVPDADFAKNLAEKIGYPVIIKAAAGGGGANAGNDTIDNRDPNNKAQNRNNDADDHTLTLTVTGFSSDTVNVNQKLTDVFSSISGSLTSGSSSTKVSSAIKMASHSMTTEVYDSLGTKHEVAIEFRKVEQTEENGTRWSMVIRVPEPAQINPDAPVYKNIITGEIRFKSDGSILGYQPSSITLTPNNGSSAGQTIALNFGTLGGFEGMRSYDAKSSTDNIAQDGYKGGTLNDLRIDENGKIIGSFTNGRSLALAQVGMATFTNNNGLENLGGNVFGETANSGAAVIGAANSGARGKISGSALEMSNVDLSRAFTQLIVVQRGYQANSKTITTSDTMLNTLLQLKQ